MSVSAELEQIDISQKLLNGLTADQRSLFAAFSLAISEIEALRSGLKAGPMAEFEPIELSQIFLCRQFALMRMISVKQMEILRTLGGEGKENKSTDEKLMEFRRKYVKPRRRAVAQLVGSRLVTELRNKVGSHYDLSQFREADSGSSNAHKLLSSKDMEFSGGILGDLYIASMLQNRGADSLAGNAKRNLKDFQDYIVSCGKLLQEIWEMFMEEFILPHSKIELKKFEVPSLLVGERKVTAFPLFMQQARGS